MANHKNEYPACVRTPKMYIWTREVLFLGTCYARQQARRSTQEKLILSLRGTLEVLTGQGRKISVRSCLIPAGLWLDSSIIDASQAVVAIYHLAPFSQDYAALSNVMTEALPGLYYGHPNEHAAIQAAIDIRNRKYVPPAEARQRLRSLLLPPELDNRNFRDFDPRIIHVAKRVRESLLAKTPLPELASEVQLSVSRLEKLFKEQAGLPITQYRMRYRVFISTILMSMGYSLTEAALCAGFSNSAHFSRSYRTLNGMTPSAVFLQPPYLDPVIDTAAVQLVAPLTEGRDVIGFR